MRVGIITSYPDDHGKKSGIAYYARTLVEPLRGCDDQIIVFADDSTLDQGELKREEEERVENVRITRCWKFGAFSSIQILLALLKQRVDVLHVEYDVYLYGGIVAAILLPIVLKAIATLRRIPITTTLHGIVAQRVVTATFLRENGFVLPHSGIGKLGFKIVYKLFDWVSDRIIVLERSLAEVLRDDYGIDPAKLFVIPLPLMNEFPKPGRESASRRCDITGRKVVLFVGYASYYKGLKVLLDAHKIVRSVDSSVELHLVASRHPRLAGDLKYEQFYQEFANECTASGVTLYDFLQDSELADVLACADVVVLPYTAAYGGSAALNTALAARKPVLVSSAMHFEGALPQQVFAPNALDCADAILRFFSGERLLLEEQLERLISARSVDPIARVNHLVRCGRELHSMTDGEYVPLTRIIVPPTPEAVSISSRASR